jgi:hypothetical protein
MFNTFSNLCNPHFWDKHEKIIGKYFYPNKLNIDLAEKLNAPIEQLDPSIIKTVELINIFNNRRTCANTESYNSQIELPNDQNPNEQFNYYINPKARIPEEIILNSPSPTPEEMIALDDSIIQAFLEHDNKFNDKKLENDNEINDKKLDDS